jgi:hypothetical protein
MVGANLNSVMQVTMTATRRKDERK